MASGGDMQNELGDLDEKQLKRQVMVTAEIARLLRIHNIMKNEVRLKDLIEDNPWLLDKVIMFSQTQERMFHKAHEDLQQMLKERESSEKKWNFYFELELKQKKCQAEYLALTWHQAIIMKLVHLMYLDKGCKWDIEFTLVVQEKFLNSRKKYENCWNDIAPILSSKILINPQTSKKEVHFCFKNLDDRRKREIIRKHQMNITQIPTSLQSESEKEKQSPKYVTELNIQMEKKETQLGHSMVYLPFAQYKLLQELERNKRNVRKEGCDKLRRKFRKVSELLILDKENMISEQSVERQSSSNQSHQSIDSLQQVLSKVDLNHQGNYHSKN